ncbi:hypothetical protein [Bifidobacterium catenulatum]|uniref:hypothetical protein n=1 Tax=Bifidobacterium catenulatum TaxID=1686 RepID=UPI00248162D2|nr:hypothetical protein [Bifidobacterium catenulatum]MDH7887832.1 hypothetical protein [Bifidobacterium catenulatum subsp. kashiwanohense]
MSRAETTAMLSELVEKRLKNQTAFWASEVNFDRNTSDNRRVDYVGFQPWNVNGEPVPASVEKGCFGFYEVKSCMADFTSGNGLTFYGDQNYLVCTKELCDEIVWQKMVPERVNAILTPRFDRLETDSRPRAVIQRPVIPSASGKRNPLGNGQGERKEDKLSIADDEAEKAYPTRYWSGTRVKEQFSCDMDDLQEAYLRGRNAPPADAEVEAVARKLMWWDMAPAWEDVMPSEDCFWTLAEPEIRANYIRDAREMLEIARKAANE